MSSPATSQSRQANWATVATATVGDAMLVQVSGTVDEHFPGLGDLTGMTTVVVDLSSLRFMTSYGVARWIKAMAAVPSAVARIYLVGCPQIFVEQIITIRDFAGRAKIMSLVIPYVCPACGAEPDELIDVIAEADNLANSVMPQRRCAQCGSELEIDTIGASYLEYLPKYGATSIHPAAAQLLAAKPNVLREQVVKRASNGARRNFDLATARPARSRWVSVLMLLVIIVFAGALGVGGYLLFGTGRF